MTNTNTKPYITDTVSHLGPKTIKYTTFTVTYSVMHSSPDNSLCERMRQLIFTTVHSACLMTTKASLHLFTKATHHYIYLLYYNYMLHKHPCNGSYS